MDKGEPPEQAERGTNYTAQRLVFLQIVIRLVRPELSFRSLEHIPSPISSRSFKNHRFNIQAV